MNSILRVEDLTMRFGGLVAVDNVSLSLQPGEILGLIGPNGAGKTTFLNLISGALKPASGKIEFQGEAIAGLNPERVCRKGVGRTFQISQPFPKMTALENVLVAALFGGAGSRKGESSIDPRSLAGQQLKYVEFSAPDGTLARNLNTAQLKRLDLARALATYPKVLLLDEIGAGLTSTELTELMQLIRRIRDERGISLIVVEHVMQIIMGICDRIAVMQQGQKIAEGSPVEIAQDEKVVDAYLGEEYLP